MIFHQCPECNKSFENVVDLFNHIESYHRQMAILTNDRCPYCESKNLSQFGTTKDGGISLKTGEIQGKEFKIYFCEDCKHLCKSNLA